MTYRVTFVDPKKLYVDVEASSFNFGDGTVQFLAAPSDRRVAFFTLTHVLSVTEVPIEPDEDEKKDEETA